MNHVGELSAHFVSYAEAYGYIGIFLWFLIIDELVPLPDEIPLITVGYLCSIGTFHYPLLAAAAAFIAFMIVDVVEFYIVATGSRFAARFEKRLNHGWLLSYKQKIQDHLPRTLFILAFIPRMRIFSPVLAAVVKVPARRFFTFDALSLGSFIVLYMGLGFFFHEGILSLFDRLGKFQHYIFAGLLMLLVVVLVFIARRARRQAKLPEIV